MGRQKVINKSGKRFLLVAIVDPFNPRSSVSIPLLTSRSLESVAKEYAREYAEKGYVCQELSGSRSVYRLYCRSRGGLGRLLIIEVLSLKDFLRGSRRI